METLSSHVLLRTDFSSDETYDGIGVDDVLATCAERLFGFIVLADRRAMTEPDHPVLVVSRSFEPGRPVPIGSG